MSITYDEFIKKHVGKAVDYDGTAGVQCVDLAKCYLKEVFGISAGAWGNAHAYYDNFTAHKELTNNFTRIANTPSFVPQKGDIAVWKTSLSSNGCGHIAICTGDGDTTYFYSYDQNWTGKHDPCTKIKHNYNHFAGVLRPKNQSVIKTTTTAKTALGTIFVANRTYKITTKSGVKIRAGAGTKYDVVGSAAKGKSYKLIEFLQVGNDIWGKISTKHWICVSSAGTLYVNATGTTTAALNYRSGAGTKYSVLGTFKKTLN